MLLSNFKKVIIADQAPPDTDELYANVDVMERNDADGTFFVIRQDNEDDAFTYDSDARAAGGTALTYDRLRPGIETYKATRFKKFWHNVLKVNLRTPNDLGQPVVDVFDPTFRLSFPHNLGQLARACEEMGVDTMFVDLEPDLTTAGWGFFKYDDRPFSVTKLGATGYSFEEYEDRMFEAGRYTAYRICRAHPRMTIIISLDAYDSVQQASTAIRARNYGLLPAFVAGMLAETARYPMVSVHSFFENQYNRNDEAGVAAERRNFNAAINNSRGFPTRIGANAPAKEFAGALYKASSVRTDWPSFDNSTPTNSYHTPTKFRDAIHYGLKDADEFQFIYTEGARAWCTSPRQVNAQYPAALTLGRYDHAQDEKANKRVHFGFDASSALSNIPNCIADMDPNLWGLSNGAALTAATYTDRVQTSQVYSFVASPTWDSTAGGTGYGGIVFNGTTQYGTFDWVGALLSAATAVLGTSAKLSYTALIACKFGSATPGSTMSVLHLSRNTASNAPIISLRGRTVTVGIIETQRANGAGGSTIIPATNSATSQISTNVELYTIQSNGAQARIWRGDQIISGDGATGGTGWETQDQHSSVAFDQGTLACSRTNATSAFYTGRILGMGIYLGCLGVEQLAYARRILGARCGKTDV